MRDRFSLNKSLAGAAFLVAAALALFLLYICEDSIYHDLVYCVCVFIVLAGALRFARNVD